ncbi:MAG TPA: HEAT repeat domain-containing protein [Chloroflexia bacterium]|nr:HEAT repeat domain-containing protein [Chloroflexia bacterium]
MVLVVETQEFETRLRDLPHTWLERQYSWSSTEADALKEAIEAVLEAGAGSTAGLVAILNDTGRVDELRAKVCLVLSHLRAKETGPSLVSALQAESLTVKIAACYAVGHFGDKRQLWPLLAIAKDRQQPLKLRQAAIEGAGWLSNRAMVVPLLRLLQIDPEPLIREAVARAFYTASMSMRFRDERVVEPFLERATDRQEHPDVRIQALYTLGITHDKRVIEPLITLLESDDNQEVRRAIGWALGGCKDERIVQPLLNRLKDQGEDLRVRQSCAWALGIEESQRIVPELLDLLQNDPEPNIRATVADTLGWIYSVAAVEPLMAKLQDRQEAEQVRARAASALGQIGDLRSLDPLLEALQDPADLVRFYAARGLGQMGSGLAIPHLERMAERETVMLPGWGKYGSLKEAALEAIDTIQNGGG